jgi:MftR C-terminal domain
MAESLRARHRGRTEAAIVAKLALACFQAAYERWVRDPGQDLPALVDGSFAALAGLAAG